MCSFGSFSKTLSKTREREKPKTRVSRRVSPRASCRLFHSLLNHGESEGIRTCVCLHPRRGRPTRSAEREAKRTKKKQKNQPRAAPREPPLRMERVFSVRSFCSSRSRTTYRLRRRGTRRKGTAGYPWSVSVSRAVQRGSGGARSFSRVRGKRKTLATLSSLPSPPALQSVCNKGRVIGTGSLLGEIR